MSSTKVKIYTNPARNVPEKHTPYIPQYKVLDITPSEHKGEVYSGINMPVVSAGSVDNPRASRPYIRSQPYAEAIPSPIGNGKGSIPNVGNNMEQSWSGIDNEIVDDVFDPNQPFIDNNEYISESAFGNSELDHMHAHVSIGEPLKFKGNFVLEEDLQKEIDDTQMSDILMNLDEEEYLLLVNGNSICSGNCEQIQEQTRALVFGEHELFPNEAVSVDDIAVVKRVKIKIGVFLD